MFRLYCGNLDSRVTEETLQDLFEENSLSVTNIVVKRGYAFVDCPDQTILDKSIDKLNGKCINPDYVSPTSFGGVSATICRRCCNKFQNMWYSPASKMADAPIPAGLSADNLPFRVFTASFLN